MHPSQRWPTRAFFVSLVGLCGLLCVPAIRAKDDPESALRREQEQRFQQTFFDIRRDASLEDSQQRHELLLQQRIKNLDRICGLSELQRKKLELAGRSSIRQFNDALATQKEAFLAEERDAQAAFNYLYQNPEILKLRRRQRNGPFDDDTLFGKTISSVLTPEQQAKLNGRSTRAEVSRTPITAANVGDLVRIGRFPMDAYRVSWSPDGQQIGCLQYNQQVKIYRLQTDKPERILGAGNKVLGFDFGPQRDLAAFVDATSQVTVLGLPNRPEFQFAAGEHQSGVVFSPDGKSLVTAGYGNKAFLWSTATGKLIRDFDVGPVTGGITPVFSPDGKLLAFGNRNSTTALYDVQGGEPGINGGKLHEFGHHMSHGLQFDPTSKTLAVSYVDGHLILWDVETGKQKAVQAWAEELYTVDWSPDGSLLVTGGYHTPLTFWNAADLTVATQYDAPEWIMSVRFSPDGTRLAVAGMNRDVADRHVETWAVP